MTGEYDTPIFEFSASILEFLGRSDEALPIIFSLERNNVSMMLYGCYAEARHYARLVDEWFTAVGLRREDYGAHSLRRTRASIICQQTGNLRAVQTLLGHTKIDSRVRYLGVDIEDALALAEGTGVSHLTSSSTSASGSPLPRSIR